MIDAFNIAIGLLPILAFLGALYAMDSFQLVPVRGLLLTLLAGAVAALLSFLINGLIIDAADWPVAAFARYGAPVVEEVVKSLWIAVLMTRRRVGFLVDAAIYGVALGAGFALVENLYYLRALENSHVLIWVVRGFGTAVMHGGTTAIFAIVTKTLLDRRSRHGIAAGVPGLLLAMAVHSAFNHFLLPPILMTLAQLVVLPALLWMTFQRSDAALRDWMDIGLDTDVEMIESINAGEFAHTPAGEYLNSLRESFPGEVVVDMFCLLRLHLELACQAKGYLLAKEVGFPIAVDPEIPEKFAELDYLRRQIGPTGKLALSPILGEHRRDLWQFHLLERKGV